MNGEKAKELCMKSVLLCIVGAVVLTILLASTVLRPLFYTRNGQDLDLIITNHGIRDESSPEEDPGTNLEIKCIQGIDHEKIPETEGWYAGGYGLACERTDRETSLVIPVEDCRYITMILVSCSSAGPVTIQAGDTTEELDLYSPDWHRVVWNYRAPSTWSLWENRTDVLALFALCLSILLAACYFGKRRSNGAAAFQSLYHAGFFVVFACILVNIIRMRTKAEPGKLLTALLPFLALHFCLGWLCRKEKESVCVFRVGGVRLTVWDLLSAAGLLVMLQVQIYIGRQLAVNPSWDFGNVYYGAQEVVENGYLVTLNNGFLQYPNNLFAVVFLTTVFKLLAPFKTATIFTGIWLNVMMIGLAVILIFLWMRMVWTPRKAFYGAMICFLLSPYYLFVPIFYTDTLSLPFAAGAVWLYEWMRRREDAGKKALWGYLLLGMVCVAGYLLKGSLVVFAIAIVMHMLMGLAGQEEGRKDRRKKGSIRLGFFAAGFAVVFLIWKMWLPASHIIDYTEREKFEFPVVQWLMMGAGGDGNWSAQDQVLATNTDTIAQRTQVCTQMFQNRIRERGFTGMFRHFMNKGAKVTWGDGLYFTYEKLKRDPLYDSWLHDYVLQDGSHFQQLVRWTSGFHIAMLLFVLFSIWKGVGSRKVDSMALIRLVVLGFMLFFFLWETRPRYLVSITPLLAVMTVDGSCYLAALADKWRSRKKRQGGPEPEREMNS